MSKADIKQALNIIRNPTYQIQDYSYKFLPIPANSRLKLIDKVSISNIYIAGFIKFWILNQSKSRYIFSFFVDTRNNNEVHHFGNHFIVADVSISKSMIESYSIEKISTIYTKNKIKKKAFLTIVI